MCFPLRRFRSGRTSASIQQLTVGEMAIAGQLYHDHYQRLVEAVRRRLDPKLRTRQDAEDIVNQAFLKGRARWAEIGLLDPRAQFVRLYGLAHDCIVGAWRFDTSAKRDARVEVPWPSDSFLQATYGLMARGSGPSGALIREERRQEIMNLFQQLPEVDREILWLRHVEGFSGKEAAAVLSITTNAAYQRYSRALQKWTTLWVSAHPPGDSQ